mmetsp:Transcript_785/g.2357  ORF Transcript_785/g.2357 Transcript_785/m.2357 type:complete len:93 (+) Transcript_785:704-982(+)
MPSLSHIDSERRQDVAGTGLDNLASCPLQKDRFLPAPKQEQARRNSASGWILEEIEPEHELSVHLDRAKLETQSKLREFIEPALRSAIGPVF